MKNNFLLFLTTTTLVLLSFILFSRNTSFPKDLNTYKSYLNKDRINKSKINQELDERGCVKTPGFNWCTSLNKCLRIWEKCPQINKKQNPIYTISECEKEGGKVTKGVVCSFAEEKLGNIENELESICCIDIQGRI
jgi:hypothetical protein